VIIDISNDICIDEIDCNGEMMINVMGAETYLDKESVAKLAKYFAQQDTKGAENPPTNTESKPCPECKGTRKVFSWSHNCRRKCSVCGGTGTAPNS